MSRSADTESLAPWPDGSQREDRLDEVLASYLRAVRRGSTPDRQRLLACHPDLADDLAEFFADQDRFDHLAAPLRAAVGPSGERLPETIGPHIILGEIARGGMGVVLRARHRELNRLVAIKLLLAGAYAPPEDVQRFRREAEAAAALDHPHIVPIYEVGEHDGLPFFSMKLLQGSLAQRLRAEEAGALPPVAFRPRDAARLLAVIAHAVHYAHARGILHRDLKPANILLDEQGEPYVSDFGLARRVGGQGLTQTGAVVGTPAYMAPEQADPRGEVTTATDVYGLGSILYELLTGKPPFRGETPLDTLRLVLDHEPVRPRVLTPQIDADLETICLKALSKEPAQRYGSALALADDLERYLRGEPIVARPVSRLARGIRWARRQPVVAGLVAALFVAILTGFGLVFHQWRRAEQERAEAQEQRDQARRARARADAAARASDASAREARAALAKVRTAQEREHKAALASDVSFRQAHAVVNDFCLSFSDELADIPRLQPLRRQLLESGRRYYQNFLKQRGDDPALRRELAETHVRVARISSAFGESQEARAEYQAALALYRQLHQEDPTDRDVRYKLAGTLSNLATQQDLRESFATTEEALSLYKRFLADQPGDPNLETSLAMLLANRGAQWVSAGRFAEARKSLEEALTRQEALLERFPGTPTALFQLSSTLDNYAVLLSRQGERAAALCSHLRAHELRMRWVAKRPWEPGRLAALAALRDNVGVAFADNGFHEAAGQAFTEALAARQKLADENPQVGAFQRDLAASLNKIGAWLRSEGNKEKALLSHKKARDILWRLLTSNPTSPGLKRMLAETHFKIALLHGSMKRPKWEGESLARARQLQEDLVRSDPENVEYRHDLGRTLQGLGLNLWVRKQVSEAKAVLSEAITSTKALVARSPGTHSYRKLLSNQYGLLARIEWLDGRASESVRLTLLRQKLWPADGWELYLVGRDLALAASPPDRNNSGQSPFRIEQQEHYLDLALAALRQAVRSGFRDVKRLRTEPALKQLQSRKEFRELLSGLE
jgi:tetratricopeptide (TPR) repeat protein